MLKYIKYFLKWTLLCILIINERESSFQIMGRKAGGLPNNNITSVRVKLKNPRDYYWAKGILSVHENYLYVSEIKDLETVTSSLCVSTCFLQHRKASSTIVHLNQQVIWRGLTNGPQGGEKTSKPQSEWRKSWWEGQSWGRSTGGRKGTCKKQGVRIYTESPTKHISNLPHGNGVISLNRVDLYFHMAAKINILPMKLL